MGLISREDALKWTTPEDWGTPDEVWRPESEYGRYIQSLPSAARKGHWVCTSSDHYKCSNCGTRASYWYNEENSCEWDKDMSEWLSDYCPNCGADMR